MEQGGTGATTVTIIQAPGGHGCVQVTVAQPDGSRPVLPLTWGQVAYLHARLGQLLLALRHGFPFDLVHRYGSVYGVELLQGASATDLTIAAHRQVVPITGDQARTLRAKLDRAMRDLAID